MEERKKGDKRVKECKKRSGNSFNMKEKENIRGTGILIG
jgi:hypothetical protein